MFFGIGRESFSSSCSRMAEISEQSLRRYSKGLGLAKGWCNRLGLNINPSKTTIVLTDFTRGLIIETAKTCCVCGMWAMPTWVPAHKCFKGNEMAHLLACSVSASGMVEELLQREERVGREKDWQLTTGLRKARLLLGGYNLARFQQIINLPRDKFRLLVATYTIYMSIASSSNCSSAT